MKEDWGREVKKGAELVTVILKGKETTSLEVVRTILTLCVLTSVNAIG